MSNKNAARLGRVLSWVCLALAATFLVMCGMAISDGAVGPAIRIGLSAATCAISGASFRISSGTFERFS